MFSTPVRIARQAPRWNTDDAHSATGVAKTSIAQFRSIGSGISRPRSSVPSGEIAMTGIESASATRKRRFMSASMDAAIRGSDMSCPIASWPPRAAVRAAASCTCSCEDTCACGSGTGFM